MGSDGTVHPNLGEQAMQLTLERAARMAEADQELASICEAASHRRLGRGLAQAQFTTDPGNLMRLQEIRVMPGTVVVGRSGIVGHTGGVDKTRALLRTGLQPSRRGCLPAELWTTQGHPQK
jgi:hypothetical protein